MIKKFPFPKLEYTLVAERSEPKPLAIPFLVPFV